MSDVEFWNQRASLGEQAGTQDLIAVELERRAIARHVKDGMRVLDVGCGTGGTALWLARHRAIRGIGIDSSPEMIRVANRTLHEVPAGDWALGFECADVLAWRGVAEPFDLIYTQRCLINLPDWPTQRAAIERVLSWVKSDGLAIFMECSIGGLKSINELRKMVDLPPIQMPWHNVYVDDAAMLDLAGELSERGIASLREASYVCSTYAVLSRVINAKLAADVGVPPSYDSPINQMALALPPYLGNYGQNRMWVFTRLP